LSRASGVAGPVVRGPKAFLDAAAAVVPAGPAAGNQFQVILTDLVTDRGGDDEVYVSQALLMHSDGDEIGDLGACQVGQCSPRIRQQKIPERGSSAIRVRTRASSWSRVGTDMRVSFSVDAIRFLALARISFGIISSDSVWIGHAAVAPAAAWHPCRLCDARLMPGDAGTS
jgi:hypothetical protein